MTPLYLYIKDSYLRLSEKDKETLLNLDKEYGELYREFWFKWDRTDCVNLEEEFDKFMRARKVGKKYYPQLKLVRDELDESWLIRARKLRKKN